MKHILPILTAALALTVSTASAVEYYSDYFKSLDYYSNAVYMTPETLVQETYFNEWYTQVIPYEQQTIDYGSYQVIRTSPNWGSFSYGEIKNSYKIRITGENVDLYLADWMDTATGIDQNDALTSKKITQYGYHFVDDKTHVDANGVEYDREVWDMQDAINDSDRYGVLEKFKVSGGETLRHGYYLGNFSAGDEIEIYLKDASGEIYSNQYRDQGGRYDAPNYDQVVAAQLGAGSLENSYEIQLEARKAMPLAELTPSSGNTVFFGIYAGAAPEITFIRDDVVGRPLPGGVQIALIAGLFGLGFWYVRRRKAIAA